MKKKYSSQNTEVRRKVLWHILISLFFLLSSHAAHAQQITLSIDPPVVNVKIKPGKSFLVAYTVKNTGDPTPLQFSIRPFKPIGRYGGVSLADTLEGPIEFRLDNTNITLEKPFFFGTNAQQQAVLRITVPPQAPEGDYYYMVLAQTMPAGSIEGKSTTVAQAQLGSPLLISVTNTGVTDIKAKIAEFTIVPDFTLRLGKVVLRLIDTNKTVPVTLVIRNEGTNSIQPQGTITARGGNTTLTVQLIPQNILSMSERLLKAMPTDGTPTYVSAVLEHLPIGNVTIGTQVTFGENAPVLLAQDTYLALPLRTFAVTTLLIGSIVLLFIWKKRVTH